MVDTIRLAQSIQRRLTGENPRIAIILGSGLGSVADQVQEPVVIAYSDIDGFPQSTVAGHSGRLVVGTLEGVRVACMQGRHHAYEGHPASHIATPIRTLQALGCRTLLLTNAAGGLQADRPPGSLMLIRDHINWAGVNPLIGVNDDTIGPRFLDMTEAYDPTLRKVLLRSAEELDIVLSEGVYVMMRGPNFETPAEVQALARLGGNAVGMSTVPECLVARHCGMRVAGLSVITNLGAGLAKEPLTHDETLAEGAQAAASVTRLITRAVKSFDEPDS